MADDDHFTIEDLDPGSVRSIQVRLEADVPIPPWGKLVKWPVLYKMRIGESFLVLVDELSSVRQASNRCRLKTGRHFTIRQVSWNAYRLWRIEPPEYVLYDPNAVQPETEK